LVIFDLEHIIKIIRLIGTILKSWII